MDALAELENLRTAFDVDTYQGQLRAPIAVRLLRRLEVDEDCWIFTGGKDTNGYGVINRSGRQYNTHRVSYELFVGKIDTGLHLDHLCYRRACVRPAHLEAVEPRINLQRAVDARWTRRMKAAPINFLDLRTGVRTQVPQIIKD